MDKFRTKRGSVTFSNTKVMMEESLKAYFTNMFEGLWEKGGAKEKIFFMLIVAFLSFCTSFVAAAFYSAPLYIKLSLSAFLLSIALAIMIYEHLNNVEKEKFIAYENINSVKFVEGIKLITCPRFIIKYEKDGEEKTRYITMPMHYVPNVQKDIESIKKAFKQKEVEVA